MCAPLRVSFSIGQANFAEATTLSKVSFGNRWFHFGYICFILVSFVSFRFHLLHLFHLVSFVSFMFHLGAIYVSFIWCGMASMVSMISNELHCGFRIVIIFDG